MWKVCIDCVFVMRKMHTDHLLYVWDFRDVCESFDVLKDCTDNLMCADMMEDMC